MTPTRRLTDPDRLITAQAVDVQVAALRTELAATEQRVRVLMAEHRLAAEQAVQALREEHRTQLQAHVHITAGIGAMHEVRWHPITSAVKALWQWVRQRLG